MLFAIGGYLWYIWSNDGTNLDQIKEQQLLPENGNVSEITQLNPEYQIPEKCKFLIYFNFNLYQFQQLLNKFNPIVHWSKPHLKCWKYAIKMRRTTAITQ